MEPLVQSRLWPYKHLEIALRYLMAIVAAHMIVVNGTNYSIFELLLLSGYYIEMGFSIAVALVIITWINFVSNRLDKRFAWESQLPVRLLLQSLFGILVPVLIEFFMVAFYFWSRARINVLRTPFMTREFRLVIFMICFFNLYCIARYFIIKWWITQNELDLYRKQLLADHKSSEMHAHSPLQETTDTNFQTETPHVFIVHTSTKSYPIPIGDIAYFYRSNGHVFLRSFNGEDAIVSQSLDQIETQVDKQEFFRVERHMIISYHAVVDYRPLNFGKIGVTLRPPYRESVSASKIMAKSFRLWIKAGGKQVKV